MFSRLRKLYFYLSHNVFTRQNSATIVIFAAIILLSALSVTAMTRNWSQHRQLEAKRVELARIQAEMQTLEQEKSYHSTREYQELLARDKQNMKLPGETMVNLPFNSDAAIHKYDAIAEVTPPPPANYQQWLQFFFN